MKVRWNLTNPTTLTSTTGGPVLHLEEGINEVDEKIFEKIMEYESNRDEVRSGHLTDPEDDGLDDEPEVHEDEGEAAEVVSDESGGAGDDETGDEDGVGGVHEAGPYDHMENLNDYTVEGASEVIGDTFKTEVLHRWVKAEKASADRVGVSKALADQLALIEGAGG